MGFFDDDMDDYDSFVGMQMTASSRQEAINLTGDDTFYMGSDDVEDEDEDKELELEFAGLDIDELEDMDEDERREALEDAGFEPDDYDDCW